ncbi:MAG: c-type cytochrome [Cyclobacteriaceae bacterium]
MTHQISGLFKNLATALLIVLSLTSFAQEISSDAGVISEGETLFNANCKACHRVKQKLIGPALAGVEDRAPSIDWIKEFVRNSSKVIASGDEYANKVYEENGKTLMTSFTSFSDDQIMSILAYTKAEAEKPEEVVAAAGGDSGGGAGVPTTYLNAILVGMVVILVLLLVILGLIINALKRYLDQKELTEEDKEVVHSPFTFSTIAQSSGFIFIVVFLVASISFKTVIDGLFSVGVQQGYAPKQPIAFSHKVHAGQYEIDCQYCHTGASIGRSANIPSPNICMNCHTQIRNGTNTGESEIAKIVAAVETNRPIEWVRIHNLPDLAYFNHSQHVNVAGVECQTCHGPIEEMDVVKQYSLLTMGWCIDCHRKTDLNTKGNAYYDNLLELHNNNAMKVEDIGGLECAKCHY